MSQSIPIAILAAIDQNDGLGHQGKLPWCISGDTKFMKTTMTATRDPTKKNLVVIGRKSWESIPPRFRPLKGRETVVLSRDAEARANIASMGRTVHAAASLTEALQLVDTTLADQIETVMVIGGVELFREAVSMPQCRTIYLTRIDCTFECDVFFPTISEREWHATRVSATQTENYLDYRFIEYTRRPVHPAPDPNSDEQGYLNLVREIIDTGVTRNDRTGTGTVAVFGRQLKFSLRDNKLPLLTTKRVFWRGVAEELLWFISGSTNARTLTEQGVPTWEKNGTREFLDKQGLTRHEEGDLGPVYGFQWRHFGAEYKNMHTDYTGQGVDQLRNVIDLIRNDPTSRRIVMTAWNPAALPRMALPPCHVLVQFFVADGELSCQMYQRSCDMGLGVPFNIASYALLTHMIAHVTGLRAGTLTHTLGDAHVYSNHIEALRKQIQRTPTTFPTLQIDPSVTDIDAIRFEHLRVSGYTPQTHIHMDMAV